MATVFEQLSKNARGVDGKHLDVKITPEAFARIEKALVAYRAALVEAGNELTDFIDHHTFWGIGDDVAGIVSAIGLGKHMTMKFHNGNDGAVDRLRQHDVVAGQIQDTFVAIRTRYYQADAEFARRFDDAMR